jgi:hypothetical protein
MKRLPPTAWLAAVLLSAAACSGDGTSLWATTTAPPATSTLATTTSAPTTTTQAGTATTAAGDPSGIGDPYFPGLGNPGYDVEHYLVELAVDPASNTLEGEVAITASATADLDVLHLDLLGLTVDSVAVDAAAAPFRREEGELIVDPAALLPAGEGFTVAVAYHGTPGSRPATSPT